MNRTFISSEGTVLQRGPVQKSIALQDFSLGILKKSYFPAPALSTILKDVFVDCSIQMRDANFFPLRVRIKYKYSKTKSPLKSNFRAFYGT